MRKTILIRPDDTDYTKAFKVLVGAGLSEAEASEALKDMRESGVILAGAPDGS